MTNSDVRFCRRSDVLFTELNDEVVALDIQGGNCFGFNDVATAVWKMLETPKTLHEICATLIEEYEVDDLTCESEVSSLIKSMQESKLLR